jgi:hypothetical protein
MKIKKLVGYALIIFGSCVSLILFLALVLLPSTRVASATDPSTGLPMPASDEASGIITDGSGLGGSDATATTASGGSTTVTPKPGTTAAPSVGKTSTPLPAVTSKPGVVTPVSTKAPTPVPTAAPTTPPVVYCGGSTPCYGKADLKANGRCWGYIGTSIINLTNYAPNHPGLSTSVTSSCGMNVAAILAGGAAGNGMSRTHSASNTTTLLSGYKVTGVFDINKP